MAEYHVKNGSHRAKAFKVKGGHQVVPAGKSDTVKDARELSEDQIDAFAKDGVKVSAKGAKAKNGAKDEGAGGDQPKPVAEVLVMADDGTHFQTFKAEATKILGDATPSTKDEIVAALRAKATA